MKPKSKVLVALRINFMDLPDVPPCNLVDTDVSENTLPPFECAVDDKLRVSNMKMEAAVFSKPMGSVNQTTGTNFKIILILKRNVISSLKCI
jgi:hypothetical protein